MAAWEEVKARVKPRGGGGTSAAAPDPHHTLPQRAPPAESLEQERGVRVLEETPYGGPAI